ncbi:hypothetical protein BRD02_11745 [Halobacteriales archaeon QS_8_69_73]|nr:MAG: hypothetical protein BRD02_11745 [Halobacteriales archaeon QS_8_69_73]
MASTTVSRSPSRRYNSTPVPSPKASMWSSASRSTLGIDASSASTGWMPPRSGVRTRSKYRMNRVLT